MREIFGRGYALGIGNRRPGQARSTLIHAIRWSWVSKRLLWLCGASRSSAVLILLLWGHTMNVRILARVVGPVAHPLSHRAVNPNSLGQQQHSVNTSDGRTADGRRRQPIDSSDENSDIFHG